MSFPASVLASIHSAFAERELAIYVAGPGAPEQPLRIVWTDEPVDPMQGINGKVRRISAEIQKADVPGRPTKSATLTRAGVTYQVKDVTPRDDVGAWVLFLGLP